MNSKLASRYLVEGAEGAVLHTGDFRAEPWFLESLVKEPALQKYLAVPDSYPHTEGPSLERLTETLEAIYLDTACLLGNDEIPTKVDSSGVCCSSTLTYVSSGNCNVRIGSSDETVPVHYSLLHKFLDMGIRRHLERSR